MDTIGATVHCGENSRFSVFEPMNDKTRKAVVVVNFGNEEDDAEVNIKGDRGDRQNSIFHSKRIRPFCYLQK